MCNKKKKKGEKRNLKYTMHVQSKKRAYYEISKMQIYTQ